MINIELTEEQAKWLSGKLASVISEISWDEKKQLKLPDNREHAETIKRKVDRQLSLVDWSRAPGKDRPWT